MSNRRKFLKNSLFTGAFVSTRNPMFYAIQAVVANIISTAEAQAQGIKSLEPLIFFNIAGGTATYFTTHSSRNSTQGDGTFRNGLGSFNCMDPNGNPAVDFRTLGRYLVNPYVDGEIYIDGNGTKVSIKENVFKHLITLRCSAADGSSNSTTFADHPARMESIGGTKKLLNGTNYFARIAGNNFGNFPFDAVAMNEPDRVNNRDTSDFVHPSRNSVFIPNGDMRQISGSIGSNGSTIFNDSNVRDLFSAAIAQLTQYGLSHKKASNYIPTMREAMEKLEVTKAAMDADYLNYLQLFKSVRTLNSCTMDMANLTNMKITMQENQNFRVNRSDVPGSLYPWDLKSGDDFRLLLSKYNEVTGYTASYYATLAVLFKYNLTHYAFVHYARDFYGPMSVVGNMSYTKRLTIGTYLDPHYNGVFKEYLNSIAFTRANDACDYVLSKIIKAQGLPAPTICRTGDYNSAPAGNNSIIEGFEHCWDACYLNFYNQDKIVEYQDRGCTYDWTKRADTSQRAVGTGNGNVAPDDFLGRTPHWGDCITTLESLYGLNEHTHNGVPLIKSANNKWSVEHLDAVGFIKKSN